MRRNAEYAGPRPMPAITLPAKRRTIDSAHTPISVTATPLMSRTGARARTTPGWPEEERGADGSSPHEREDDQPADDAAIGLKDECGECRPEGQVQTDEPERPDERRCRGQEHRTSRRRYGERRAQRRSPTGASRDDVRDREDEDGTCRMQRGEQPEDEVERIGRVFDQDPGEQRAGGQSEQRRDPIHQAADAAPRRLQVEEPRADGPQRGTGSTGRSGCAR